jgi:hypothetical protein
VSSCTDPGLHPRFYSPGGEAKPFSAPLFCGVNVAGADPRLIVQVCGPCWPGSRAFGSSSGHGPRAAALHSKLGQPLCGDEELESTVVPTFNWRVVGLGGRSEQAEDRATSSCGPTLKRVAGVGLLKVGVLKPGFLAATTSGWSSIRVLT